MKRTLWIAMTLAAVFCVTGLPARAGVMYSDFGSGYGYNAYEGWAVDGADSGWGEQEVANLFTPTLSGAVIQIDLALGLESGDGNATVSLWSSSAGELGTELDSWNVTATYPFGNCCGVLTIPGITGLSLSAGQSYFLMTVADATSAEAWNLNSQGVTGVVAYSADDSNWNYPSGQILGAFDVIGGASGVPEPGTILLLGAGLLCVLARRRAVR